MRMLTTEKYIAGGPGSHSWVLVLRAQCFSLQAIPKNWKPWFSRHARRNYPLRRPFFSLQWPNIYNSCGQRHQSRKDRRNRYDNIVNFYHKRKKERWEEYT